MPETLMEQLIRHEGLRLKLYADQGGRVTIGVGRNLTDCGISREEALALLDHDIHAAEADLNELIDDWARLTEARRFALIDMRFNLGEAGFREFKGMLAALAVGDFPTAAASMRASLWHRQVGARAMELAAMVETGRFPDERPK